MPDITMCATPDCPIAPTCRRSAASGMVPAQRQGFDTWHWRRSSFSERVECNGFEAIVTTREDQR